MSKKPETVRIDGEVAIPRATIKDWFTRIDELLELLLRVEAKQLEILKIIAGGLPVTVPTAPPGAVTTVEMAKANRYDVVTLDLSTPRNDEPIGLSLKHIVASSMTWITVEAPLTYKLNSTSNKSIPASTGALHENWEITEIYVSNEAAAGKQAILYYEWRE